MPRTQWHSAIMTPDEALAERRILCVEDHADTSAMYRVMLQLEGYAFESAATANDARDLIAVNHYDLFVLDHGLEGDDTGVDLCQWIREREAAIPIIVASGKAYPRERSESLVAGANAYLVKPIEPALLLATVQRLLDAARPD